MNRLRLCWLKGGFPKPYSTCITIDRDGNHISTPDIEWSSIFFIFYNQSQDKKSYQICRHFQLPKQEEKELIADVEYIYRVTRKSERITGAHP